MKLIYADITESIIGSAFSKWTPLGEVYKILGYGFLEKVYQRALQVELLHRSHNVELEKPIKVKYKGTNVGDYVADILVDDKVLVEL
jgi:GxxExxY protein